MPGTRLRDERGQAAIELGGLLVADRELDLGARPLPAGDGAVYDAPEPTVPSPKRWFPELLQSELQALWEGAALAGVPPDRAREFYDAEIAVARTRPAEPGVPAFKLFENGPPWHTTAAECADLVRISVERSAPELDPDPEREGWRQWQELRGLFEQGAAADGVITS